MESTAIGCSVCLIFTGARGEKPVRLSKLNVYLKGK
jgi:hypothetical protein